MQVIIKLAVRWYLQGHTERPQIVYVEALDSKHYVNRVLFSIECSAPESTQPRKIGLEVGTVVQTSFVNCNLK